ncbi:hypothetical protein [Flavilitoribacter nigricans]|uniref:DUF4856 domain-containing protein n=1 Tax=Flavilitoribacter nigricans (strain ATCC 23147 / DSM 23189 / NBRC 102662 / NCIMB 1420 / SS-2) TaxID=1122177 RepID=A0A2D0N6Z2_FLAN2|nr:hypothetical protein [Flavilitoribacter nigricans]PHN03543.1 hypothetical protein CRP01_26455 [Flavilitoribacter nigricans DSM 23189 = NBRC 102662]
MDIYKITRLSGLLIIVALFGACEKDVQPIINYDFVYEGDNFETNAAAELELRNALSALASEMKNGRTAGTQVDYNQLLSLYQAGTPSLASTSTTYYQNRIEGAGGWLEELSKASGGTYTPGTPTGEGGVYEGYLFNEYGLELEQMVEKGLFAAALYNYAAAILDGSHDETTADRVVALFGAHPDFSNSDNSSVDNPDTFSAKYTARRDKNDGLGMYYIMVNNFEVLQTAIRIGDDLDTQKRLAIAALKTTWERAIFATAINYLHSAISKLSSTNPTDADQASALHAYSEVIGFIHGWREIAPAQKLITDSEIDDLLLTLNAPYDAAPASYTFATDPVNELPKMTQAIDKIQAIYSFTDQQIQDFKENWVSKQGR